MWGCRFIPTWKKPIHSRSKCPSTKPCAEPCACRRCLWRRRSRRRRKSNFTQNSAIIAEFWFQPFLRRCICHVHNSENYKLFRVIIYLAHNALVSLKATGSRFLSGLRFLLRLPRLAPFGVSPIQFRLRNGDDQLEGIAEARELGSFFAHKLPLPCKRRTVNLGCVALICVVMEVVACESRFVFDVLPAYDAEICPMRPLINVFVDNRSVHEESNLSFFVPLIRLWKGGSIFMSLREKRGRIDFFITEESSRAASHFWTDRFNPTFKFNSVGPIFVPALNIIPVAGCYHLISRSASGIFNEKLIELRKIFNATYAQTIRGVLSDHSHIAMEELVCLRVAWFCSGWLSFQPLGDGFCNPITKNIRATFIMNSLSLF